MWILQGPKKTFRLTAGSVKTTRDGAEVEDLKSTDGIYVNDKRVKRAIVSGCPIGGTLT